MFLKGWSRIRHFSAASRLLLAAALLHIALTGGLFAVGRAQILPNLVDRDGIMKSLAFDSYNYRREALGLPIENPNDPSGAYPAPHSRGHVKILSLEFAVLGRFFGYTILSAEPFNLLSYLSILIIVLMLGRETGIERFALLPVAIVALWPTLLIHSTQFLKDTPFIALGLALILIVTTWITRTYTWRGAVISWLALAAVSGLLLLLRLKFAGFIFVIVCLGLVCLIVRQIHERRLLYRNLICPLFIVAVTVVATIYLAPTANHRFKPYPSGQIGVNKLTAPEQLRTVLYRERPSFKRPATDTILLRLKALADLALNGLSTARSDFNTSYPGSGSLIDSEITFTSYRDMVRYVPRAMAVGLWAPFPRMWIRAGAQVGMTGRIVAGAETLVMYLFELLTLVALWRAPRDLESWLWLSTYLLGVAGLGMVVSNVGALYRVRYLFLILLIMLAAKAIENIVTRRRAGQSLRHESGPIGEPQLPAAATHRLKTGLAVIAILICVVAASCALFAALPGQSAGMLDFALINRTRSPLDGIYISPHDSAGWEEDILGEEKLPNGQTVTIMFGPEDESKKWDLRVEIKSKGGAEWKDLTLREISRIILRVSEDEKTFYAEIQ